MTDDELLLQKRLTELAEKAYSRGTYTFTPFLSLAEQEVLARTERYIESLLSTPPAKKRSASVGAFLNNLTQNLQKIQLAGIPAVSERRETDSQIVLTITIPK